MSRKPTTIHEMLVDYANRGCSRAMVCRELKWSRNKLYSIMEDLPPIPWKPFWQTLEYMDARRGIDFSKINTSEKMAAMRAMLPAARYSVLGKTGTVEELMGVLGPLCDVSACTIRKRLNRGYSVEDAFLLPNHKGTTAKALKMQK